MSHTGGAVPHHHPDDQLLLQRNLLRILAVTATHWNLSYRKRTPPRAAIRLPLSVPIRSLDCERWASPSFPIRISPNACAQTQR